MERFPQNPGPCSPVPKKRTHELFLSSAASQGVVFPVHTASWLAIGAKLLMNRQAEPCVLPGRSRLKSRTVFDIRPLRSHCSFASPALQAPLVSHWPCGCSGDQAPFHKSQQTRQPPVPSAGHIAQTRPLLLSKLSVSMGSITEGLKFFHYQSHWASFFFFF